MVMEWYLLRVFLVEYLLIILCKHVRDKLRILKKTLRNSFSIFARMSPVLASQVIFFKTFNRKLNLKNPKTFNEKLMWLKLFEDDTIKTKLTDKFLVRNYLKDIDYSNLLVELYGVYEQVKEIDFDSLPNSFVLKCTHASGYNIICPNKNQLNLENTKKQITRWMNTDFSVFNVEPHYSKIKPRIIIEKYIDVTDESIPIDFKFHCFHGVPKVIEVVLNRWSEVKKDIMYDCEWNILPYNTDSVNFKGKLDKPKRLYEMIEIAKNLSKEFTYVRVDLYYCKEVIYFGEFTFTPAACLDTDFIGDSELMMGNLIDLTVSNKSDIKTIS